ncbi:MAG: hypothetical protein AAFV93_20520, partial [Chloroflexota bacterium]
MNNKINEQAQNNEDLMDEKEFLNSEQAPENDPQVSDDSDVDIEELKATIVRLHKESETNLDGWQRSRAEFDNFR